MTKRYLSGGLYKCSLNLSVIFLVVHDIALKKYGVLLAIIQIPTHSSVFRILQHVCIGCILAVAGVDALMWATSQRS